MPHVVSDDFDRALQRILETVPTVSNRALLARYVAERRGNGIKTGTLLNDANAIRSLAEVLGQTPFESATKTEILAWANQTSRERVYRSRRRDREATLTRRRVALGPRTLGIRRIVIKQFYRWFRETDDYPPEVRFLKARPPRREAMPTDALLSKWEVKAIVQAHAEPREQALFAVLYESGLRAAEFCALNVGSVEFQQDYATLTLPKDAPGLKTGARQVLLFESVPYLQKWWEVHPLRGDARAPLFVSMSRRAPRARLTPTALNVMCHRGAKAAGIQKRVHPHLFRHTAATERARQGWSEGEMRAMFGWSPGSDMPATYVHLAGKDYQEMELERRGLLKSGPRSESALKGRACGSCDAKNLPTAAFCAACRAPLAPGAVQALADKRFEEVSRAVTTIMQQMLDQFAGQPMVVSHLEPLKGVSGADLERAYLRWRKTQTSAPEASTPPWMKRAVKAEA